MDPIHVMYVSEIIEVEQGRISDIDDTAALVKPGLEHTTGFGTHTARSRMSSYHERRR